MRIKHLTITSIASLLTLSAMLSTASPLASSSYLNFSEYVDGGAGVHALTLKKLSFTLDGTGGQSYLARVVNTNIYNTLPGTTHNSPASQLLFKEAIAIIAEQGAGPFTGNLKVSYVATYNGQTLTSPSYSIPIVDNKISGAAPPEWCVAGKANNASSSAYTELYYNTNTNTITLDGTTSDLGGCTTSS